MKSIFFITIFALFKINLGYASDLKICLTGTTVKSIPTYGEAFVNGAEMAKELALKKFGKNIEIKKFYYDRTGLAPLNAAKEMVKDGCHAIIGFCTGNDLLAVKDYVKKENILVYSIYGDFHQDLQAAPSLMTIQPKASFLMDKFFQKIEATTKAIDKYLIVTSIDRSEMNSYYLAYTEKLKSMRKSYLTVNVLEKTGNIDPFVEAYRKEKNNIKGIILLTRSVVAAQLSDFVFEENKGQNLPIILGTGYFGSSALPAFLNYAKHKEITAYFPTLNCLCDPNKNFQNFVQTYRSKFNLEPMLLSAYTYDAVNFIAQSIHNEKRALTKERTYQLARQEKFKGISDIDIQPGLRPQINKIFVMKVTSKGYESI